MAGEISEDVRVHAHTAAVPQLWPASKSSHGSGRFSGVRQTIPIWTPSRVLDISSNHLLPFSMFLADIHGLAD